MLVHVHSDFVINHIIENINKQWYLHFVSVKIENTFLVLIGECLKFSAMKILAECCIYL